MSTDTNTHTQAGLRYARWAGRILSVVLIVLSFRLLTAEAASGFETFKSGFFLVYALILNLPYQKLPESKWKFIYGALVVLSMAFVFVMIASVMFAYMAAAERGERLGVPGFEGMLIFFALMQVPVVLFQRRPDLLD
jgi:hypothetical protein